MCQVMSTCPECQALIEEAICTNCGLVLDDFVIDSPNFTQAKSTVVRKGPLERQALIQQRLEHRLRGLCVQFRLSNPVQEASWRLYRGYLERVGLEGKGWKKQLLILHAALYQSAKPLLLNLQTLAGLAECSIKELVGWIKKLSSFSSSSKSTHPLYALERLVDQVLTQKPHLLPHRLGLLGVAAKMLSLVETGRGGGEGWAEAALIWAARVWGFRLKSVEIERGVENVCSDVRVCRLGNLLNKQVAQRWGIQLKRKQLVPYLWDLLMQEETRDYYQIWQGALKELSAPPPPSAQASFSTTPRPSVTLESAKVEEKERRIREDWQKEELDDLDLSLEEFNKIYRT